MRWPWVVAVVGAGCALDYGQFDVDDPLGAGASGGGGTGASTGAGADGGGGFGAGAPRSDWWDADYAFRRQVRVTAGSADVPEGASVFVSVDTKGLVEGARVRPDENDYRVVRFQGGIWVELDRWIDRGEGDGWNGRDTHTWFRVAAPIDAGEADADTYLYYGHPDEDTAPRADILGVFVFGDDFETTLGRWTMNDRGEQAAVQTNEVRAGTRALSIQPGSTPAAGLHRDQALPASPLEISLYLWQSVSGASFGYLRFFKVGWASRSVGWNDQGLRVFSELDSGDRLQFDDFESNPVWFDGFGTDVWRRVVVHYDQAQNRTRGRVDDGAWSSWYADVDESGEPLLSLALEGEGQGGEFLVDDLLVDPEPTVELGGVEER
jgi:hypothetical protein